MPLDGELKTNIEGFFRAVATADDLLEKIGINKAIDGDGNTLLHYAAKHDKGALIRYLVMLHHADLYATNHYKLIPLNYAIQAGNLDAVKVLVECGTDLDFANHDEGRSPLKIAIDSNELEIAKYLLAEGANVNFVVDNRTLLQCAIENGNSFSLIKLLIDYDANVNALGTAGPNELICGYDDHDAGFCPPLLLALFNNDLTVANYILEHGANVNLTTMNGTTLLHWCVEHTKSKAVTFLIDHGANVDAKNQDGKIPSDLIDESLGETVSLIRQMFKLSGKEIDTANNSKLLAINGVFSQPHINLEANKKDKAATSGRASPEVKVINSEANQEDKPAVNGRASPTAGK